MSLIARVGNRFLVFYISHGEFVFIHFAHKHSLSWFITSKYHVYGITAKLALGLLDDKGDFTHFKTSIETHLENECT